MLWFQRPAGLRQIEMPPLYEAPHLARQQSNQDIILKIIFETSVEVLDLSVCNKLTLDGISHVGNFCQNLSYLSFTSCGNCIEALILDLPYLSTVNFSIWKPVEIELITLNKLLNTSYFCNPEVFQTIFLHIEVFDRSKEVPYISWQWSEKGVSMFY